MRVLVFGGGSVGLVFGALLGRRGHDVSIVTRPLHVAALRGEGLKLSGSMGEAKLEVTAVSHVDELSPEPFDLVLVTVKSYDTLTAIQACRHLLRPETMVLSLQNGLGNVEALAKEVPASRVLGSTLLLACDLVGPGHAKLTSILQRITIGALEPSFPTSYLRSLSSELEAAGLEVHVTDNLQGELWGKLLVSSIINPLSAIRGCLVGDLVRYEPTSLLVGAIIEEIFLVAARAGVRLRWSHPLEFEKEFRGVIVPSLARHRTSMLQDIDAGRRTEIDAINGFIVDLARRHSLSVPVNERLVELVEAKQSWLRKTA